jgi:hypothetical protein
MGSGRWRVSQVVEYHCMQSHLQELLGSMAPLVKTDTVLGCKGGHPMVVPRQHKSFYPEAR